VVLTPPWEVEGFSLVCLEEAMYADAERSGTLSFWQQ
jgi:hypothetical protein